MNAFSCRKWIFAFVLLSGCGAQELLEEPVVISPDPDDEISNGVVDENTALTDSEFWVRPKIDIEGDELNKLRMVIDKVDLENDPQANLARISNEEGERCKVDEISGSYEDRLLSCVIQAEELELYMHGVTLEFNFPKKLCEYGYFKPYWFYNRLPGVGPTAFNMVEGLSGARSLVGGSIVAVGSSSTVTLTGTSNAPVCSFDYTPSEGPNCCQGKYTSRILREVECTEYNVDTNADDIMDAYSDDIPSYQRIGYVLGAGQVLTAVQAAGGSANSCFESNPASQSSWPTESSNAEWGGKAANCAAGPAMDSGPKEGVTGLPVGTVYQIKGKNRQDTYTIAPLENKALGFAAYIANFFINPWESMKDVNEDGVADYETGFGGASAADRPVALRKLTTAVTGLTRSIELRPNPFYEFACLDDAWEIKSAKRVFVQKWNLKEEFQKYLDGSASTPDPDKETAPSDPDAFPEPFSDLVDWNDTGVDVINSFPAIDIKN